MWCRPVPSSVSPMYMPGRLRTASRPLRTWMLSSLYESALAPLPLPFVVSPGGFGAPVGGSEVVIFDRSIARPSGKLLDDVQVSPLATNLNSFNNLASFTRFVKAAYHGFSTTLPARTRKSRRGASPDGAGADEKIAPGGLPGRDDVALGDRDESLAIEAPDHLEQQRPARRVQLARNVVEQQHGRVAQARLDVGELGELQRQDQRAQLALR